MKKNIYVKTISLLSAILLIAGCTTSSFELQQENPVDFEVAQGPAGELGRSILERQGGTQVNIGVLVGTPASDEVIVNLEQQVINNLNLAISEHNEFDIWSNDAINKLVTPEQAKQIANGKTVELSQDAPRYLLVYDIIDYDFVQQTIYDVDDNLLMYETNLAYEEEDPLKRRIALNDAHERATVEVPIYKGFVKIRFVVYDSDENIVKYSKVLSSQSEAYSRTKGDVSLLNEAVATTVKDYVNQYSKDFNPPAVVIMTKGSGKAAMLNIGSNDNIRNGTQIEFFEYISDGYKLRAIPYAIGEVFELDADSCWVLVDDYKTRKVRKYSLARVKHIQDSAFGMVNMIRLR